jgi:hypothetical protein
VGIAPAANAATGVSPNPVANSAASQQLTITGDSLAVLYVADPAVVLYGPGVSSSGIAGTGTTDDGTTIKTTFDFANVGGAPMGPGAYTLSMGTSLTVSTKVDTVGLTVTGPAPDVTGNSLAIEPGGSENPVTLTSAADSTFATGDAVSFTDNTDAAVSGLAFTPATITASTMTGTFTATSGVAPGTYNLVVTDTSGQKGTCTGCVSVMAGPSAVPNLTATPTSSTTATLTWDPPADESLTLQGYNVVVSTDPNATQTDAGVTVSGHGTSTGATVTGLTPGTVYHVSVTATDSAGTSPPSKTTFATPYPTAISMNVSAPVVVYGHSVTFNGLVDRTTSTSIQSISHATVYILVRHGKKKARVFRQLTTNSNGAYHVTFTPTSNATYAALYAGRAGTATSPGDSAALSILATVGVAPKITITSASKKSYHLGAFTVTGKVAPGSRGKRVYLATVDPLGNHKKIAYVTVGKGSKFRFHEALLRKKGTYHLQVLIAAHGQLSAGHSATFTIRRT